MEPNEVGLAPAGRWGGRLTSRPLPESDDAIGELEPAARAIVAEVWAARAVSERRVAEAFRVVEGALTALGADEKLVALAVRAVDDEMRHTELSRVVASRYAGRPLASAPALEPSVPRHVGASERLRHVLHVVGQCCMNETIASAFLEAALAEAEAPLATAALRELLSDEVDHARIGWALLASLDPSTRAAIEPWLASMASANLRMWRTAPRVYPRGPTDSSLAAHGVPCEAAVEASLVRAFRDLIVIGFEELGIDTSAIHAWLEAGAPTPSG